MTKEDIIRMAQEAGFEGCAELTWEDVICTEELVAFAKLVAQHEREACAKDLYEASEAAKDVDPQGFVWRAVKECADAIRARGQA
jgi:hypothetical protein